MTIPKKIYPDPVRDSIVDIGFKSEIPYEVLVGKFYEELKEDYNYVSGTRNSNIEHKQGNEQNLINVNLSSKGIFYDDSVKLEIEPNKIVINFNASKSSKYIGWETFFPKIKEIINITFRINVIDEITRVGVRYISEFPDTNIVNKINAEFKANVQLPELNTLAFRANFENTQFFYTTTVSNELNKKDSEGDEKMVSLIDIDVYTKNREILNQSFDSLVNAIDSAHSEQKSLFFDLLTKEFLASLNPEY